MQKQLRQTNFELLRIIAISLISLMHGIRSAYGSSYPLNEIVHISINSIGNMGVTLFILISGYFSIRLRPSKILGLWSVILFYSLLIFCIRCYFKEMPLPEEEGYKEFLKQLYNALTPLTTGTWWFITSYFILLMLSPLLNKAADYMSRFHFMYLLFTLLIFYSLSPTFLRHSLSNEPCGKCTENMIMAYFIGRYIARFGLPQIISDHCLMILMGCITLIFCVDYFIFDPLFMAKDHNLFIILGAICILHLFGKETIKGKSIGAIICYCATFAFPIYLLNIFLIDHLEPFYIDYRNSSYFLPYYLLSQCAIFIITFLIELIRRFIMSPIDKHIKSIDNYVQEWLHNRSFYNINSN